MIEKIKPICESLPGVARHRRQSAHRNYGMGRACQSSTSRAAHCHRHTVRPVSSRAVGRVESFTLLKENIFILKLIFY